MIVVRPSQPQKSKGRNGRSNGRNGRKVAPAPDEAFATSLGLANLDELKAQARTALEREYTGLSRLRVKRSLLDALAAGASFTVPEGMLDGEFSQIWQRVEADLKAGRLDNELTQFRYDALLDAHRRGGKSRRSGNKVRRRAGGTNGRRQRCLGARR